MKCAQCFFDIENENVLHCPKCYSPAFWFYLPARCDVCGYFYQDIEVHHIDGNRNNNVLSNKIKVCKYCHTKIHFGLKTNPPGRMSNEFKHKVYDDLVNANLNRFRNLLNNSKFKDAKEVNENKIYL